jgi:VanZ family protein
LISNSDKKRTLKDFFIYRIPPFIYAGIILYLSSLSASKIQSIKIIPDYILHFAEYGIFMWLIMRFVKNTYRIGIWSCLLGFTIVAIFAVIDEIYQLYVPGRMSSVRDVVADTVGALVAMGIYIYVDRFKIMDTDLND